MKTTDRNRKQLSPHEMQFLPLDCEIAPKDAFIKINVMAAQLWSQYGLDSIEIARDTPQPKP